MKRLMVIGLFLLLLLAAALLFTLLNCPPPGCALSSERRALARLKNRTALPEGKDFDNRVTLEALLLPGEDEARWSSSRAATIEGYVVAVGDGAIEAANCFALGGRDTHIDVALGMNAPPRERMVAEITPRMREWARRQGMDWTTNSLRRKLPGHWCRFEGWLLFDSEHAVESEHTAPGGAVNWRATAWEIHPVTGLQVVR